MTLRKTKRDQGQTSEVLTTMPPAGFQPLSVRSGKRKPFLLIDGIPVDAQDGLMSLCFQEFRSEDEMEQVRALLRPEQWNPSWSTAANLEANMRVSNDFFLDVIDLLLRRGSRVGFSQSVKSWLQLSGSVWTVDSSSGTLSRVVATEMNNAYIDAVATWDNCAMHLSDAWRYAFSRETDPVKAWDACTDSLEALLKPLTIPKSNLATLGKMIDAMNAAPQKWRFDGDRGGKGDPKVFVAALEYVGYGPDRHPTPSPPTTTLEQARAVVLQTVTIVEWVRHGLLVRLVP